MGISGVSNSAGTGDVGITLHQGATLAATDGSGTGILATASGAKGGVTVNVNGTIDPPDIGVNASITNAANSSAVNVPVGASGSITANDIGILASTAGTGSVTATTTAGSVVNQGVNHPRSAAGGFGELRLWHRLGFFHRRENARARRGDALGRLASRAVADFRRRRLRRLGRAHRHAQDASARRESPAGHPVDEVAQGLAQRRPVADFRDRFQIVAAAGARPPDDARRHPCAKRRDDEIAGPGVEMRGDAVAIGGVDGDREQRVDDLSLARLVRGRHRAGLA